MVLPTLRNVAAMYLSRSDLAALWTLEQELQKGTSMLTMIVYRTLHLALKNCLQCISKWLTVDCSRGIARLLSLHCCLAGDRVS